MDATARRFLCCIALFATAFLCAISTGEAVAQSEGDDSTGSTDSVVAPPLVIAQPVIIDVPTVIMEPTTVATPPLVITQPVIIEAPILIVPGRDVPEIAIEMPTLVSSTVVSQFILIGETPGADAAIIGIEPVDWTYSFIGTVIKSVNNVSVVLTYSVDEETIGKVVSAEPQMDHYIRIYDLSPQTTYTIKVVLYESIGNAFETHVLVVTTPMQPVSLRDAAPARFALTQNAPNPFNPSTTIRFTVAQGAPVNLTIYSTTGQLVRTLVDGSIGAGAHEITWDGMDSAGRSVASGVYLYRLQSSDRVAAKRLTLVR